MSTINIAQECGCFKRSALENNVTFDNKDDAMMKAPQPAASGGCCGGGHCS